METSHPKILQSAEIESSSPTTALHSTVNISRDQQLLQIQTRLRSAGSHPLRDTQYRRRCMVFWLRIHGNCHSTQGRDTVTHARLLLRTIWQLPLLFESWKHGIVSEKSTDIGLE